MTARNVLMPSGGLQPAQLATDTACAAAAGLDCAVCACAQLIRITGNNKDLKQKNRTIEGT